LKQNHQQLNEIDHFYHRKIVYFTMVGKLSIFFDVFVQKMYILLAAKIKK